MLFSCTMILTAKNKCVVACVFLKTTERLGRDLNDHPVPLPHHGQDCQLIQVFLWTQSSIRLVYNSLSFFKHTAVFIVLFGSYFVCYQWHIIFTKRVYCVYDGGLINREMEKKGLNLSCSYCCARTVQYAADQ